MAGSLDAAAPSSPANGRFPLGQETGEWQSARAVETRRRTASTRTAMSFPGAGPLRKGLIPASRTERLRSSARTALGAHRGQGPHARPWAGG